MPRPFKGDIKLDVRDSKPDWGAFLDDKAPKDAPNVLVILYDDTGQAAWSPYGGRINMPTLDRLAKNGLIFSQWHTTAVCSPTRSTFLTGRNHHQNGCGSISEAASGFSGYSGHIPLENATIAQVLRDAGWSTFWVGKNHNVPVDAFSIASSKKRWPLGLGYDRFYGFIGGETNQWYPELIEDNHYVEQPALPEDGYHFSKDIADKAISFIRDSKQSQPEKPWYLWCCPGANHAPHHAPQEYIDKYKGVFDDGYEAYREWVLARMIERGILPEGTELTPINPMSEGTYVEGDLVRPWDTLSDDEKRLFCRMAEVYAGFSEYTDAQIGRVIDYLEESGQLDNTLIFYCADNGASGEGTPNGSVNEYRFFNGYPDDIESNLAMIDKLGSPDTYNHYPTGWAVAFSTPYRMFKRYSQYSGGTCDPLIIHWPKGIKAKGEVRDQYHHCTDIMPTILECCGVEMPDVVDGIKQSPLAGVSMKYTFDDAKAPTTKETQYYEMFGTRGIWHKGWKAATEHSPMPSDMGNFDKDRWQLFHVEEDRAEAHDLADQHPKKLKELQDLWMDEAKKNNVLPLSDLGVGAAHALQFRADPPTGGQYVYYPGTTEIPEASAARTLGISFKILAEVEFTGDSRGIIVSQGSRFGGYALFVKGGKLF
jgi:arylsulfatase A-like enzyme